MTDFIYVFDHNGRIRLIDINRKHKQVPKIKQRNLNTPLTRANVTFKIAPPNNKNNTAANFEAKASSLTFKPFKSNNITTTPTKPLNLNASNNPLFPSYNIGEFNPLKLIKVDPLKLNKIDPVKLGESERLSDFDPLDESERLKSKLDELERLSEFNPLDESERSSEVDPLRLKSDDFVPLDELERLSEFDPLRLSELNPLDEL